MGLPQSTPWPLEHNLLSHCRLDHSRELLPHFGKAPRNLGCPGFSPDCSFASSATSFISIELMKGIPSRPLASELDVFTPRVAVVVIEPFLDFL